MTPAIPDQLRLLVEDWRQRANDPGSYVPAARDAYIACGAALDRALTQLYESPLEPMDTEALTRARHGNHSDP